MFMSGFPGDLEAAHAKATQLAREAIANVAGLLQHITRKISSSKKCILFSSKQVYSGEAFLTNSKVFKMKRIEGGTTKLG